MDFFFSTLLIPDYSAFCDFWAVSPFNPVLFEYLWA